MTDTAPVVDDAPVAPEGQAPPDADTNADDDKWDEESARRKWAKANKEAAGLRARLKELEPMAQKAKALEEAGKSEQDKLREALEAERGGRTTAETALLRHEVAAAKGVPANLAKFLVGATKAEVETSADELLKEIGTTKPGMPGRPTERLASGQPSSTLDDESPEALIAKARGQNKPLL